MIDESKIKEAANNYVGCEPSRDEGSQLSAERASFMDGAQWAQQEFIKTLWHDASEEPKECDIVVQIINRINNMPYYEVAQKSLIYEWKDMVRVNGIKKWCYLSDILPKEGGER